jgi:hypothetical protein
MPCVSSLEPLDEPYNAEAAEHCGATALRKAHQKTRKLASRRMTILTRYADQSGCSLVVFVVRGYLN